MSHRKTLADRLLRIAAILGIAAFEAARAQVEPSVTAAAAASSPRSISSGTTTRQGRLELRRFRKAPRSRTALVRSADTAPGETRVVLAARQPLAATAGPLLCAIFEKLEDGPAEVSVTGAPVFDTAAQIVEAPPRRRR